MAKKHFNLETELTGKIDDLTAKLNRANSQIGKYKNQTKKHNKDVQQSFKGTGAAINDVGSAIANGGITSLPALFKASQAAINSATTGMKGFKKVLLSSGIGAVVVAIGALAAAFTASEEGAARFRKIWMPITVTFDNVIDVLADLGEYLINAFKNPQEAVKDLLKLIKDNLVTRLQAVGNLFVSLKDIGVGSFKLIGASIKSIWSDQSAAIKNAKSEVKNAASDMGKAVLQATTGFTDDQLKKTKDLWNQNTAEMKQAAALSDKIYQTDLKERKQLVERARVEAKIAALKLQSREVELTDIDESIRLLKEAQKLEDQLLKTDMEIAKARRDIQIEQNTYARSNTDNLNKEAELIAKVSNLEKTRLDQQTATQRRLNSLTARSTSLLKQHTKEQEAYRKELEKTTENFKVLSRDSEKYNTKRLETGKLENNISKNTEYAIQSQTELDNQLALTQETARLTGDAVSSAFQALGGNLLDSLQDSEKGLVRFAGLMGETALQLISMALANSVANAIQGGTQSGVGTGPAAVFTTPAFIATSVAGVLSAFAAIPSFATGGVVTGSSFTGDNVIARVNSGEMILNQSQQTKLFNSLNSGATGNQVEFRIDGTELVGVLNNHNRRINKFK